MDKQAFEAIYNESRNGANKMTRHWAHKRFLRSDGVIELADTGCHWLTDIVATECVPLVLKHEQQAIFKAEVKDSKAKLTLSFTDDSVAWKRHIEFTDMPEGTWSFCLGYDGVYVAMILLSEY